MKNNNIFIAFSNKKTAVSIAKIVIANRMNAVCITTSLAELRKSILPYENGTVICGCHFKDGYIAHFIDDVPENINIIVVGSRSQLEELESERIFKLAVPLQKMDLVCSLNMLSSMDNYMRLKARDPEEEKLLLRAKRILIGRYSMTEEQAHRYIQKKSMDTGKKLSDIAKIIISD